MNKEELQEEINKVSSERIFMNIGYEVLKQHLQNNPGAKEQEQFEKLEKDLAAVSRRQHELLILLRSMKYKYLLSYDELVTDVHNGEPESNKREEVVYFDTDCPIDTETAGWNPELKGFDQLMVEVHTFISNFRSIRYENLQIERVE